MTEYKVGKYNDIIRNATCDKMIENNGYKISILADKEYNENACLRHARMSRC